jgi:hypothetical protein
MEDEEVIIFREVMPTGQPDWNREYKRLKSGEYIGNLNSIGFNDAISAIYIHPRLTITVWEHADRGGRGINFSGQYAQVIGFSDLKAAGFLRNISSLQVGQNVALNDWRGSCCAQENGPFTSQSKCGHYWNQEYGSCGNLGCTGESLKTNITCQNWCKNNPTYCDVMKSQFCREHPTDAYCGCINDTPQALAERTKYSKYSSLGTVPRKCWPSSPCNSGTDLVNTFITTELSPNIGCPTSLINQINEINAAEGATVFANQGQEATTTSGTDGAGSVDQLNAGYTPKDTTQIYGQSSSTGTKKNILIFFIFFILLIIMVIVGYFIFFQKSVI